MESLISPHRRIDKIRYLKINPQYINFTNGHRMPDDAFVIPIGPFSEILHESVGPRYILLRTTPLFDSDEVLSKTARTCNIGPFFNTGTLKVMCSCIVAGDNTPTAFLRNAIENSIATDLVNSSACGESGSISKKSGYGKKITLFLRNIFESIATGKPITKYDQNHSCPVLFAALARHFYIPDKK